METDRQRQADRQTEKDRHRMKQRERVRVSPSNQYDPLSGSQRCAGD